MLGFVPQPNLQSYAAITANIVFQTLRSPQPPLKRGALRKPQKITNSSEVFST